MKILLGPGFEGLSIALTELAIECASAASPEEAWGWHQAVPDSPRLWIIGPAQWLCQFTQPPWAGLFHLVASIDSTLPAALNGQCVAHVGPMSDTRLADFIQAMQWPRAKTLDGTLTSTTRGMVNWFGRGGMPPQLRQHQGSVAVPVVTDSQERWPAAQWIAPGSESRPLPMPLLLPDQWQAQRTALDALAQLRVNRHA